MTTEPTPTTFDDDGNVIALGDKFSVPATELLVWDKQEQRWKRLATPDEARRDKREANAVTTDPGLPEGMTALPDDYLPPDWPWPT